MVESDSSIEEPMPLSWLRHQTKTTISHEFASLHSVGEDEKQITEFQDHDIYIDVHPFVKNTVWLGSPNKSESYINCSRIQSSFLEKHCHMIATQGPKPNTINSFWRLVLQERVLMIVTLAHQIPGDCAKYLPFEENEKLTDGSIEVICSQVTKNEKYLTVRELQVKDSNGSVCTVTHYHFKGWPDWETPAGGSLKVFRSLIETATDFVIAQEKQDPSSSGRLLVHCRAGIGRTGTTMALINAMISRH